ncbi:MAG: FGGY-family carbohydrate kinase [Pseudomonadota bacterium]
MSGTPLVIGLDSSTTATKAIAWDMTGTAVAEGRAPVAMTNPKLGHFEQDSRDWWHAAATALKACTEAVDPSAIKGLAISNQRETVGFLDADGEPVRPAMLWVDERSRNEVRELSETFGAERIHEITGRPPDLTPCLYRLLWFTKNEPELAAKTKVYCDVQTFLVQRLCGGSFRTSWSSADPLGMFDLKARTWSAPLLEAIAIDEAQLPEAHPPGTALGTVTKAAAEATGLLEGTPVFAGGGDGQLAGLGTNCTRSDRAYINLGTAVVSGVWSPDYLFNPAWRSQIAGQGKGYIFENCLRSGTFLVNWFVDNFVPGGRDDPSVFQRLEEEALALPVGSDGVMLQPYWSGVMDPHWDVDARGVILGLSASHRPAHVYRAILEGITLDQVGRTRSMEAAMGASVDHYLAIGGGAASPLWRQMLADASGKEVRLSGTVEASALGAGMLAAAGAGLFPSIEDAAAEMSGETTSIAPDANVAERYAALLDIYQTLFAATRDVNRRLVAFAAGDE